jgi:hypothetical protein
MVRRPLVWYPCLFVQAFLPLSQPTQIFKVPRVHANSETYHLTAHRVAYLLFASRLVIDFFNQINMLYESVSASCTKESCPVMNAGAKCVL